MIPKNRFIAAALLIFLIAGTIPLMGAAADKITGRSGVTSDDLALKPTDNAAAVGSTYSSYKVIKLDTWTKSDANLVWLKNPSNGATYLLTVKPNTGNMGIDIWTLLNSALISGKYVTVYTDSSGYIYEVTLFA